GARPAAGEPVGPPRQHPGGARRLVGLLAVHQLDRDDGVQRPVGHTARAVTAWAQPTRNQPLLRRNCRLPPSGPCGWTLFAPPSAWLSRSLVAARLRSSASRNRSFTSSEPDFDSVIETSTPGELVSSASHARRAGSSD